MAAGDHLFAAGILAGEIMDDISRDFKDHPFLKEIEPALIELVANVGCALLGIAFLHSDPKLDSRRFMITRKKIELFAELQRSMRNSEVN